MMDEAGFSMLVDTTSEPLCMKAERLMSGDWSAFGVGGKPPRKPSAPTAQDDATRPDWEQRVIDEGRELNDRLGKLCDYMATAPYDALDEISRHLLGKQLEYMRDYAHILGMRIARFG